MKFVRRLVAVIALVALGTSLGVAQTMKAPDLAAQLDGVTTKLKGAMLNTRMEIQEAELKCAWMTGWRA